MNNKKRAIADREGLASDEEEVEDLGLWRRLRKSVHATYERKTRGPRVGTEGKLLSISVSVWNP
jgi:hypothetical protein